MVIVKILVILKIYSVSYRSSRKFFNKHQELIDILRIDVILNAWRGSILLPKKRTSLRYPTVIRNLEEYQGILDDGSQFSIFDYDPLPPDVATQETVRFEGPSWSMNDYPSLMLSLGLSPRVECSNCEKNVRLREGTNNCPFCKSPLSVRDIYPTLSGRSIEDKKENEHPHGSGEASQVAQVDLLNVAEKEDPFDPMNTPYRPGMTKEEIFDLMMEKMIRKGEMITPEIKAIMEKLAEGAADMGRKKYDKDGGENRGENDDRKAQK
jgi:hypothetical protein